MNGAAPGKKWNLKNISFITENGVIGKMILDTGADISAVSASLVKRAGLRVEPFPGKAPRVKVASGMAIDALGTVVLPVTVRLMLTLEDGLEAHWDRSFSLGGVWVLPWEQSPYDLFVSYEHWNFGHRDGEPMSPLGNLAWMVAHGAHLCDSPRASEPGKEKADTVVIQRRSETSVRRDSGPGTSAGVVAAVLAEPTEDELRARIRAQFGDTRTETTAAVKRRLEDLLVAHRKVFTPVNPEECSEVIDFEVIGQKTPVSFRVNLSRLVHKEAAEEGLADWVRRGICEKVPWDTPSYGFVIVVPKANGKWRVTINPSSLNNFTQRIDPEGGYMPASMVREAQLTGTAEIAATLDMAEAFTTMKLSPRASELATFTSPLGKLRWRNGFFGWHSFPAAFQRIIMEKVVLPAMDVHTRLIILAWIDDLVVAARTADMLVDAMETLLEKILAIGGRLSLDKCKFFVTIFDWCGIQVNLGTKEWRIAPERVASLTDTPNPVDREGLRHCLGVLRYYFFGVTNQLEQRKRIAKLAELDVPGLQVARHWTKEHSDALREALAEVVRGDWLLVYNPGQPVIMTTDASGEHGYCVTAHQYDTVTGKMRPIAYFSTGWKGAQCGWPPQVKEMYAIRQGACVIMPAAYPYARVTALCDNANLAAQRASVDKRVVRWKQDVEHAGVTQRQWIPGIWNTIADYGSRSVVADKDAPLSEEEKFELHIYALEKEYEENVVYACGIHPAGEEEEEVGSEALAPSAVLVPTSVPGHLPMAPLLAKITMAQEVAPLTEKAAWKGRHFSTVVLGRKTITLFDGRAMVPHSATDIKSVLLRMAHDDTAHYLGAQRTVWQLQRQARVHWVGMDKDVAEYVDSCYKCSLGKAAMHSKPAMVGTLSPTLAPHVHHTWYADFKEGANKIGYLLVIVEAISRSVRLRYCEDNKADTVLEEMEDVVGSFGTAPVILRSDGGAPFDSGKYNAWCETHGIKPVLGIAGHSQGQGLVETKLKGIAWALVSVMGAKAPGGWYKDAKLLSRLERVINSSITSPVHGSPTYVLTGREPRTPLAAAVDWTGPAYAETLLLADGDFEENDVIEIIARYHDQINKVQGRATLATSLAQALTKREWDAARTPSTFKVGDWVLVYKAAPNRLTPHFVGPYQVTHTLEDGNFVKARHFLDVDGKEHGPYHVSRLLAFNYSRATAADIVDWQLVEGAAVVESVLGHRRMEDGSYDFNITWLGEPTPFWVRGADVRRVTKVKEYCQGLGLPPPGTGSRFSLRTAPPRSGRGRARGRGRGRG